MDTKPSKIVLPKLQNNQYQTVLDFLTDRFKHISQTTWSDRFIQGKITNQHQEALTSTAPYCAGDTIFYYREVEQEPKLPENEQIVLENEHIIIAHKPHFMPVMPSGKFVKQSLQNKLRESHNNPDIQSIHRLDRDTAGLVIFSKQPDTRHLYHQLFSQRQIHKTYQAIANIKPGLDLTGKYWEIKNCIKRSSPSFLMHIDHDAINNNSHSHIRCLQQSNNMALFELKPITGKTHQLRLHMLTLGYPILNDRFYPTLQPKAEDDWQKPLQLLAQKLTFIDPITHQQISTKSTESLTLK